MTSTLPRDLDLAGVDPSALSTRARRILRDVAWPMTEGVALDEIAESHGWSRRQVGRLLDELRAELLGLGVRVPLPAHTDEERSALRDSIERFGVVAPVIVDENGEVVDGHERRKLAARLGVPCPEHTVTGLDAEARHELTLALNLARRHVTRAQRRLLVESEVARDPTRSDRWIAAVCGVDHKTVASVRRSLEQRGDVGSFPTRRDRAGREQPLAPAGDPAEASERTSRVTVTATAEELAAWQEAAGVFGTSVGEWLRALGNEAVGR